MNHPLFAFGLPSGPDMIVISCAIILVIVLLIPQFRLNKGSKEAHLRLDQIRQQSREVSENFQESQKLRMEMEKEFLVILKETNEILKEILKTLNKG